VSGSGSFSLSTDSDRTPVRVDSQDSQVSDGETERGKYIVKSKEFLFFLWSGCSKIYRTGISYSHCIFSLSLRHTHTDIYGEAKCRTHYLAFEKLQIIIIINIIGDKSNFTLSYLVNLFNYFSRLASPEQSVHS